MCIFNISTPSTGSRHKLQGRSIPDESFVVTEQKKIWDDNYFLFHFRINKTKHRMEGKVILMMRLSQLNAAYFLEGIVGVYDIKIHWKNYVFWPKLIQLLIFMGAKSKVSCTKKFAWTFRPYFWKKGNQRNFQFQTRRFLQHLSQFIIRGSWPPPSPPLPSISAILPQTSFFNQRTTCQMFHPNIFCFGQWLRDLRNLKVILLIGLLPTTNIINN